MVSLHSSPEELTVANRRMAKPHPMRHLSDLRWTHDVAVNFSARGGSPSRVPSATTNGE
jgi:hypothetical protein